MGFSSTSTLSCISKGATPRASQCFTPTDGSAKPASSPEFSKRPHDSILLSCSSFKLNGSVLCALCLGSDGLMKTSQIDLDDCYANENGLFCSGGEGFYGTSGEISLKVSFEAVTLRTTLRYSNMTWRQAEVDLAICIVNVDGRLTFVKHDGWLARDGIVALCFERIPIVGFVVAAFHFAVGHDDHAMRAVARCANSTTLTIGIGIGSLLVGPIGAAIGAGAVTSFAIVLEKVASAMIEDPRLKGQFDEATWGRCLYETLRNMLAAGVGAYVGELIAVVSSPLFDQTLKRLAVILVKSVVADAGETVVYLQLKKMFDALIKGRLPREWF